MQLKDVMTRNVETIYPEASIHDAAKKMRTYNVGDLPVVRNHEPVGFITDRDIVVRLAAEGWDPDAIRVRNLMTRQVHCCSENQSVQDCVRLMKEKKIRRVLIVDEDKKLTGIVSASDLIDIEMAVKK